MKDWRSEAESFKAYVMEAFTFIYDYGFQYSEQHSTSMPTNTSIVFMGKHVAIIVGIDMREKDVNLEIVRVRDGQLKYYWDGGYSSDFFSYLVKEKGYRGGFMIEGVGSSSIKPDDYNGKIHALVDSWIALLRKYGKSLFEDTVNSLPGE